MDAAGVDLAMVCSLAQRIENDFIIELVGRHPDRFFGFGQVMPQADDALDEIEPDRRRRAVRPQAAPQPARLPRGRPRPARPGLRQVRRARPAGPDQRARRRVLRAARDRGDRPGHPEVPTIIAHMGAVWNVPEAIIVAERNPHIYLETSATLVSDVRGPTPGSARRRSCWAASGPAPTSTWSA
jgi:predicted TIM-barrel fold metal-dependent hydrolase